MAGPGPRRAAARTTSSAPSSFYLSDRDAIGPVTARFVVAGIARADRDRRGAVVIQLDTPGGLDTSMREIVKAILASGVPVIVYVSPPGARAASAGMFITMAAPVAAMAPGTNIGAATPVSIGVAREAAGDALA